MNGLVGVYSGKAEQPAKTRAANGANKRLAHAAQVWLAVNHNCYTSITSGECVLCSERIARARDLGSCQSNL